MAIGPGKYDRFATLVRVVTGSAGVVLLAVGGEGGPGFSVQGTLEFQRAVPRLSDDGCEWLQMHSVEQENDFAIVCKLEPLEGEKWPSTNKQN